MDSPIHPELRTIAKVLPRGGFLVHARPVVRGLETVQERSASWLGRMRSGARSVAVERGGTWSVRVHRPARPVATPAPALLWIHGGGYVIGTALQEDSVCREMAQTLGIVVAAVDYRLAPAHPFPAPLDDCHEALVWLAGQPGIDPQRIAIGGASAGGGLAASLALLARARGEVSPAFQVLSYPMLDDRTVLRADLDERSFRLWNNVANRFGWAAYLGREPGGDGISDIAVPARHADLTGLPPAWIGVGTLDLFHDEDVAYAERLRAAGVECALDVVDGAFHGFDYLRPKASISKGYRDAQIQALRAGLRLEE